MNLRKFLYFLGIFVLIPYFAFGQGFSGNTGGGKATSIPGFRTTATCYVSPGGSDTAATGRGSWESPYKTVQGMINGCAATPTTVGEYDTPTTLYIDTGEYDEDVTIPTRGQLTIVFAPEAGIHGVTTISLDSTKQFSSTKFPIPEYLFTARMGAEPGQFHSGRNAYMGVQDTSIIIANDATHPITDIRLTTSEMRHAGVIRATGPDMAYRIACAQSGFTVGQGNGNPDAGNTLTSPVLDLPSSNSASTLVSFGCYYRGAVKVRAVARAWGDQFRGAITTTADGYNSGADDQTTQIYGLGFKDVTFEPGTSPPTGFSYTCAAGTGRMDSRSRKSFLLNGWTLGGSCTIVNETDLGPFSLLTNSSTAYLHVQNTGAATNEQVVSYGTDGIYFTSDNLSSSNQVIKYNRTGTTPGTLEINNTLTCDSTLVAAGQLNVGAAISLTGSNQRIFSASNNDITVSANGSTNRTIIQNEDAVHAVAEVKGTVPRFAWNSTNSLADSTRWDSLVARTGGVGTNSNWCMRVLSDNEATVNNAMCLARSTTTPGALSVANLTNCTGVQTNGSGTLSCTASDANLKQLFGNFDRGLVDIVKMQPREWQWAKDNPMTETYKDWNAHYGLIAQDVDNAIPEAISKFSHDSGRHWYMQIDYAVVTAVIVNAFKQLYEMEKADRASATAQQATDEAHTIMIKDLQNQIAEMQKRITQLENNTISHKVP